MRLVKYLGATALVLGLAAQSQAAHISMDDYDMGSNGTLDAEPFGNLMPSPALAAKLIFNSGLTFSGNFLVTGFDIYQGGSLLVSTTGPCLDQVIASKRTITCTLSAPAALDVTPLFVHPFGTGHVQGGGNDNFAIDLQVAAVPEPATLGLVGLALAAVAFVRKRAA